MIAVDTNILVYASRKDSGFHARALERLRALAEGSSAWAIPWPVIHEFLAVVTHPRVYEPPTPIRTALDQVQAWTESPGLILLAESEGYWSRLGDVVGRGAICGPGVHDARIAALCLHHGVRELWSADRDFSRVAGLKVVNPLIG